MAAKRYIHQILGWPAYEYDLRALMPLLERVLVQQGVLFGKLGALGFEDLQEAQLAAIASEIVKSSEIEGERLDMDVVRGSVARWLGMERGGIAGSDHYTDGVVAMAMDAGQNYELPLTSDRIYNWHAALFPTGRNAYGTIIVGDWRDDAKGPMEVVSQGKRKKTIVHFEAPPAEFVPEQMRTFLDWFENEGEASAVLKAGIAHLWFVTIHPLDDGNGRIGRGILDMGLARADQRPYRCYSVSTQIRKERDGYYDALQAAQQGNGDYTGWLTWFLGCFGRAIEAAIEVVGGAMHRTRFWQAHQAAALNDRQHKVISSMLMNPTTPITRKKWSTIGRCSAPTATRDLEEMVAKGILMSVGAGGRGAAYVVVPITDEAEEE